MTNIRALASQTAIYGLSSIVGRLINYLLVPLYTRIFFTTEYGVVSELYAYFTFLNIIFLYGMETAFFRFSSDNENPQKVYNTILTSVLFSTIGLGSFLILFAPKIASLLHYSEQVELIYYLAGIISLDAICAIPFVKLRLENKALKFASIKIINIFLNIFFNLYFLVWCPYMFTKDPTSIFILGYNPEIRVAYVFISNLLASAFTLIILYREFLSAKLSIDKVLLKKILIYSLPLLPAGLAGMTNETIDRILLKYLLPYSLNENLSQIGIYSAAYKLSIFMTLAIQAFRMAAEPFFFSVFKKDNAKNLYGIIMNYFVIACTIIFLGVMFHINIIQLLIGKSYREGLAVVPILLLANLFLGIYLNLSIWFKLTNKTIFGAYFAFFGAAITIVLNFLWIPVFGYTGSAYATLICYFSMATICWLVGAKYYPIPYSINKIFIYLILMGVFYFIGKWIQDKMVLSILIKQILLSSLFILYVLLLVAIEKPGKLFLKK